AQRVDDQQVRRPDGVRRVRDLFHFVRAWPVVGPGHAVGHHHAGGRRPEHSGLDPDAVRWRGAVGPSLPLLRGAVLLKGHLGDTLLVRDARLHHPGGVLVVPPRRLIRHALLTHHGRVLGVAPRRVGAVAVERRGHRAHGGNTARAHHAGPQYG